MKWVIVAVGALGLFGGGVALGLKLPSSKSAYASAAKSVIPSFAGAEPLNGIDPAREAENFWETWHLVTTRYRKDNNQTRFVYANDIAWEAMLKRSTDYPDGSMFAKIIFNSEDDPVFPASKVPKAYSEVEFMKKDAKAYADSAGWGYSFYHYDPARNNHNAIPPTRAVMLERNCVGCHSIVKSRDHVFALPAFLQWFRQDATADESHFENQFVEIAVADLPISLGKEVVSRFGGKTQKVKFFLMPFFFTGQEMALVSVAEFAVRQNVPHLVLSKSPKTFVFAAPTGGKCASYAMNVPGKRKFVDYGRICDSKIETQGTRSIWYKDESL